MIRRERLSATLNGDYVVFLIGMRINRPLQVHKWLPGKQSAAGRLGRRAEVDQ